MRNLIRKIVESDERLEVAGIAMNGNFALRKMESINPDVIVLDLEMPELDGIGFLEKRLEMGWDVPVVILSAVARKGAEITMKALSLGASDFVTKPTGGSADDNRKTAEELIGMLAGHGGAYRRKRAGLSRSESDRSAAGTNGGTPDSRTPDSRTPDSRTPDSRTPDSRTPDSRTPDSRTPDSRTPDSRTPDSRTPDSRTPDDRTPDSTSAGIGSGNRARAVTARNNQNRPIRTGFSFNPRFQG